MKTFTCGCKIDTTMKKTRYCDKLQAILYSFIYYSASGLSLGERVADMTAQHWSDNRGF